MTKSKAWFEMQDQQKSRLNESTWVTLFSNREFTTGAYPNPGYEQEYVGAIAVTLPEDTKDPVAAIQWTGVFVDRNGPRVDGDEYVWAHE